MSFVDYKKFIEEGDDVIIYVGYKLSYHVTIKWGETFQTKFGALRHEYAVGKPYGCKIQCTKGYVYILHPTPELWTQNVDHRTQILYPPDINQIIFGLDIRPGSVIGEAGTGSGALSHAIARTIHPGGHLWTFDFHEVRATVARDEFVAHKLGDLISVAHRDVCRDGFDEGLNGKLDAVFLDLPKPWEALPFAKKALKACGGRVCCFSPCIEQTQRNSLTLHQLGFVEVATVELVIRHLRVTEVSQISLKPKASLPFLPDTNISADSDSVASIAAQPPEKRARLEPEGGTGTGETGETILCEGNSPIDDDLGDVNSREEVCGRKPGDLSSDKDSSIIVDSEAMPLNQFTSVVPCPVKQPTHSGFLTFATLPPMFASSLSDEGVRE